MNDEKKDKLERINGEDAQKTDAVSTNTGADTQDTQYTSFEKEVPASEESLQSQDSQQSTTSDRVLTSITEASPQSEAVSDESEAGISSAQQVTETQTSSVDTSQAVTKSELSDNESESSLGQSEVLTSESEPTPTDRQESSAGTPPSEPELASGESTQAPNEMLQSDSSLPQESKPSDEKLSPTEIPDAKWYVVHTYSGYEQKAKVALEERIKQKNLQKYFERILIPSENVIELVRGQKKTTTRKFFPGYMLVKMVLNDTTWHLVKSTPKITGFVGNAINPPSVPEEEVLRITNQMEEGSLKPRPKVEFEAGESVRVIDGPFVNFNGIVEEVRPDKGKLRVMVSIFGRSTPVELDFVQVEKN